MATTKEKQPDDEALDSKTIGDNIDDYTDDRGTLESQMLGGSTQPKTSQINERKLL